MAQTITLTNDRLLKIIFRDQVYCTAGADHGASARSIILCLLTIIDMTLDL